MKKIKFYMIGLIFILLLSGKSVYSMGNKNIEKSNVSIKLPDFYYADENYIYYTSYSDGKIYKMSLDGKRKFKITNDRALDMAFIILNNDLYYVNEGDNNLNTIKITGSEKKSLNVKVDSPYTRLFALNGKLYLTNDDGSINSVGKDGIIKDNIIYGIEGNYLPTIKENSGFLYASDSDGLYKIDPFKGKRELIYQGFLYSKFVIDNEWIYFINKSGKGLMKVDTNGKDAEKIYDGNLISFGPDYDMGKVEFNNGSLYFIDYNNEFSGKLIRYRGNEKKEILKDVIDFCPCKDSIYAIVGNETGDLYMLRDESKKFVKTGRFIFCIEAGKGIILVEKSSDPEDYYGKIYYYISGNLLELK